MPWCLSLSLVSLGQPSTASLELWQDAHLILGEDKAFPPSLTRGIDPLVLAISVQILLSIAVSSWGIPSAMSLSNSLWQQLNPVFLPDLSGKGWIGCEGRLKSAGSRTWESVSAFQNYDQVILRLMVCFYVYLLPLPIFLSLLGYTSTSLGLFRSLRLTF